MSTSNLNAEAGPSNHKPAPTNAASSSSSATAAKIAKNKRLPATMITPSGSVQPSTKSKSSKTKQMSKKQKARSEKGRERAVELSGRLEEKVKGREERKAKRNKAKNAWD